MVLVNHLLAANNGGGGQWGDGRYLPYRLFRSLIIATNVVLQVR